MLSLLLSSALAVTPTPEASVLNTGDKPYAVHLSAELGTLAVLAHRVQFSKDGTMVDYTEDAGQDNLFPYTRFQADLDLGERHTVAFLYQPLDLITKTQLPRDITVDGQTFLADTPMRFRYGFSFVRTSWLYDLDESPRKEFALGLSMQIRNATIEFESLDGTRFRSNRDIGPVPILKMRTRRPLGEAGAFWGFEADGFYAPIKYLNGSDTDVVGAIVDTSLRVGVPLKHGTDAFINLRYIGGGGEGTSDEFQAPADGYVENWLNLMALSLGAQLR